MSYPMPAEEPPRLEVVKGRGAALDGHWASDHWDAGRLGIPARRGRGRARFDTITQDWLREPVKRWSRLRLATGCAIMTIAAGALALTRFSPFSPSATPKLVTRRGSPAPCSRTTLPGCSPRDTRPPREPCLFR